MEAIVVAVVALLVALLAWFQIAWAAWRRHQAAKRSLNPEACAEAVLRLSRRQGSSAPDRGQLQAPQQ